MGADEGGASRPDDGASSGGVREGGTGSSSGGEEIDSGSSSSGGGDVSGPLDDEFNGGALSGAWTVLNGGQFARSVSGGTLRMVPSTNCVWFHADEGPALVKLVTGDFKVTTSVRARRASAPGSPPPREFQFAGLIARDPASAGPSVPESYVFTVMGERGGWLTNETKNTIGGSSDVHGPNEGRANADAELRICRVGQVFRLYNRPPSGGAWKLEQTYDRSGAPLPETLQVGPIAYTYTNSPDLVGEFDWVRFRPVTSAADCTTD